MMSRTGLGTLWKLDSSGNIIDCDQWSNLLNSACWGAGVPYQNIPFAPTAPPATDCTQFWNALTSSDCSLATYLSSKAILPVALIAAGAIALLLIRR